MILSTILYLITQIVLGVGAKVLVMPFIVADYTRSLTEGLIIILGFYIGSFIIGVFSPGRRIIEPVLGAVAAIVAAFSVSNFTPQMGGWFRVDGVAMMGTAALLAGSIAAFGSYSGEKLMGNVEE